MPTEPPTDRAEALRNLLLSLAQDKTISDELLVEALALLKKPIGQFSVAEYKLNQLLDELLAGNIQANELTQAWLRIQHDKPKTPYAPAYPATHARIPNTAPIDFKASKPFIAIILLLTFLGIVYLKWGDYQIWLVNQRELAADSAAKGIGQAGYARQYVSEGINLASMAKIAVAEYYASMGQYPGSNAQAGLPAPQAIRGDAVSSVAVGDGGVITVRFNHLVGEDKALALIPSSTGGGPVVWNCDGGSLPPETLPPHCR